MDEQQLILALNLQPELTAQAILLSIQSQDELTQIVQFVQRAVQLGAVSQDAGLRFMQTLQLAVSSARRGAKLNYLNKITNNCPEGTELMYYKSGGLICAKCVAIAKKEPGGVMNGIKKELTAGKTPKKPVKAVDAKNGQTPKTPVKKVDAKKQTTWTDKDDAKFLKLKTKSVRSGLTPEEKRDSTNLQIKWNNASNRNKYEIEEKCGGKIKKKKCGGSMKKDKCGSKLIAKNGIKAKACPVCGKVHAGKCGGKAKKHQLGGIISAINSLKNGGSLNGIPFTRMVVSQQHLLQK